MTGAELLALAQQDRVRANGVAGRHATADELYGGAPWWRATCAPARSSTS